MPSPEVSPPRVLVVDDEASIAMFASEVLAEEGFLVESASHGVEAIERIVAGARFDLVVSDVNMPRMGGFELRDRIRRRESTPFVFMSAADPAVEQEIASSLGTDRLLLKPFPAMDLVRAVRVALGIARSARGPLREHLERTMAQVADASETGVLVAFHETRMKRVVFLRGSTAFAASNDPRDLIGQTLLRTRLISEGDLLAALSAEGEPGTKGPRLAAALDAMRKLTPEQCQAAFAFKIRESVLDLFLWSAGVVEFQAGGVDRSEASFPLSLDTRALLAEGLRRRTRWSEVAKDIPNPTLRLERLVPWPARFTETPGDQYLGRLIDRGMSVGQILLELRGQDYGVGVRLSEMIRAGVVRAASEALFEPAAPEEPSPEDQERARMELDLASRLKSSAGDASTLKTPARPFPAISAAPPRAARPAPSFATPAATILSEGLTKLRGGDFPGAREAFIDVLSLEPMNVLARARLNDAEEALARARRLAGMADDCRVELAVPLSRLAGSKLSPEEAFLFSRLTRGAVTIQDLIRVAPIAPQRILEVLDRNITAGFLTLRAPDKR